MSTEEKLIEKEFQAIKNIMPDGDFEKLVKNTNIMYLTKTQRAAVLTPISLLDKHFEQSCCPDVIYNWLNPEK